MKERLDGEQIHALVEAYLRADFFGGSSRRAAGSALTTGALFQAALAIGVGVFLYMGLPPFELLVAGLTFTAAITALVLGPEAAEMLRTDDERLAPFPVSRATARAARALHAAAIVVLGTSAAALPIATYAGVALGSFAAALATFLAALQQTLFFAALVAGLEGLLGASAAGSRARPLVTFLVGAALVAALLAGVRPMPDLARMIRDAGSLLWAFPPAWFAGEALAAAGLAEAIPSQLSAAPWVAAAATLLALALVFLARPGGAPPRASRLRASAARSRLAALFVSSAQRATFDFTLDTIPRERDLALRAAPIFAFPAALLAVGAAIADPKERGTFVHVLLFVANAYLPAAVLLLSRSGHARARWVFDTAPLRDPAALRAGIWKASIALLGVPLWLVLAICDAAVRGPATAALHAPVVAVIGAWVLDAAVARLPDPFPFGRDRERLAGDAGEGVVALAVGLTLFAFVEAWLVTNPIGTLAATALLLLAISTTRRLRARAPTR